MSRILTALPITSRLLVAVCDDTVKDGQIRVVAHFFGECRETNAKLFVRAQYMDKLVEALVKSRPKWTELTPSSPRSRGSREVCRLNRHIRRLKTENRLKLSNMT